jgi:hypothetical protein
LGNKKRRQLIRDALSDTMAQVDDLLRELQARHPLSPDIEKGQTVDDPKFEALKRHVQEIDALLGSGLRRPERWGDLQRHLYFGLVGDLVDILNVDWPKVKAGLSAGLYDENEPVPVDVEDLGQLASSRPTGSIATRLKWELLDAEGFERLLFALIARTQGYENPAWLMKTNAPDRGRDLSVTRVIGDQLGGVMRSRVIIQCKHWLSRSINVADVAELKEQMKIWEPPRVDVLVVATSGRFSSDAVLAIERHNNEDRALRIEMWAESHLERLLAERPSIVAEFRLR